MSNISAAVIFADLRSLNSLPMMVGQQAAFTRADWGLSVNDEPVLIVQTDYQGDDDFTADHFATDFRFCGITDDSAFVTALQGVLSSHGLTSDAVSIGEDGQLLITFPAE